VGRQPTLGDYLRGSLQHVSRPGYNTSIDLGSVFNIKMGCHENKIISHRRIQTNSENDIRNRPLFPQIKKFFY
jgi:hypothetical protein